VDYLSIGSLIGPAPSRVPGAIPARVSPADERKWEALFQTGRIPKNPVEKQGFMKFLCRQLESVAVNTLFQAARRTVPQDGLLSGGFAGAMYQGLADEEYAKQIAARGGFGIGNALFAQVMGQRAYSRRAAGPGGAGRAQGAEPQWFGYDDLPQKTPSQASNSSDGVR
jgi:Rod binding domain-containing protein